MRALPLLPAAAITGAEPAAAAAAKRELLLRAACCCLQAAPITRWPGSTSVSQAAGQAPGLAGSKAATDAPGAWRRLQGDGDMQSTHRMGAVLPAKAASPMAAAAER
jgi:hypothetical protein